MRNEVRNLRGACDLSQQQLGEATGVSRQTVNAIEKERYTPSLPLASGVDPAPSSGAGERQRH